MPKNSPTEIPAAIRTMFNHAPIIAGEDPEAYVRESIVNPNKVVVDGYKSDVMPQSYADSLSVQEIDALVSYLTGTK